MNNIDQGPAIGNFSLSNGAQGSAGGNVYFGASGGIGSATISGANTTLYAGAYLLVGYNTTTSANTTYGGTGNLTISAGGRVNSIGALIGAAGGTGSVTITGAGSSLQNLGYLYIGQDTAGSAGYGSVSVLPGALLSTSSLIIAPTGALVSSASIVASASITNAGTFRNSGTLSLTNNITNSGTFNQTGPITTSSTSTFTNTAGVATFGSNAKLANLSITGGTVDLTNSKFVIEASSKASTLTALQVNIANHSLISSTLAANFGLALVDNAALTTHFNTFGGNPADTNSILIAPELLGDANIDGHVDLNDLNTVLNHLGTTTPNWTNGNFDHAATINLNDLNDVLNNLGVSFANNATVLAAEALLQASPSTPIPEPACLCIVLPAAASVLLRRRRFTF